MRSTLRFSIIVVMISMYYLNVYSQDFPDEILISRTHNIKSEILGEERLVFVFLPYSYYKDSLKNYPVHYVTDAPVQANLYF